jgi:hypothetical protein
MIEKQNYTAILFFNPGTLRPRKYRNVNNILSFYKNVAEPSKCLYFNLYDKKTTMFVKRVYLKY